jgi:hypothetical protein
MRSLIYFGRSIAVLLMRASACPSRSPLVALSGHKNRVGECLLLSAKQTLMIQTSMSANDP